MAGDFECPVGQIILDEVRSIREDVKENGKEITILQGQVENLGKRANGFNNFVAASKLSRGEKIKVIGVASGWAAVALMIMLEVLKVI